MSIANLIDSLVKDNRVRKNGISSEDIGDYRRHKLKIEYGCVKKIIKQLNTIQKN